MRFGERVVVFILRPIYRTFFERLFWWFLLKIKVFMLADVQVQLANIEARLASDESRRLGMDEWRQRWAAIDDRLRAAEAANAAQWDALEQLLLALYRLPESRNLDSELKQGGVSEAPVSSASDLSRAHAASNLR